MSARRGMISRVTMPPPRMDPAIINYDSRPPERPIFSALMVVWRGRWVLAVCMALGLAYGVYKVSNFVPMYRSSSTIEITPPPTVLQLIVTNPNDTSGYLYTQCEILHSTAILSKAMSFPGVADTDCLRNAPDAVGYLKNSVFAGPEKEGSLITVWMVSRNPQDAATIVNGVVGAYLAYQAEQHQSYASQVISIINKSINEQQADLKAIQQKITDFRKENTGLVLENEAAGSGSEVQRMEDEASRKSLQFGIAVSAAAAFSHDAVQLKHIVDEANSRTQMPPDTDPALDPAMVDELHRAQALIPGLPKNNPQRIELLAKVENLQTALRQQNDAAAQRYTTYLQSELDSSKSAEAILKAQLDLDRGKLIEANSKQAEYDNLLQQMHQTERALDVLYGQAKSVPIGQDTTPLTASILEPAKPSLDTDGAKRSSTLMMGIVGGIMIGLGGALLLEMMEQRLRTVEEVTKLLAPPVLGSVPHIIPKAGPGNKNVLRSPWLSRLKMAMSLSTRRRRRSLQTLKQRGQVMHLQPRCDVSEAYRTIRTAIYFGLAGSPAKTILVTSPSSGDGKTTLASNLAISIAQTGRRVLLIDADCWHPAQGAIFEIEDRPGLTEILQGKATLTEVAQKTAVENLDVLLCGKIPENPAELLGGQAWIDLLAFASEQYDQILIDSPPVVPITDARILAASCGATILVLRAEKSTRRQADDAFEALTSVGATILGMVVNDVVRQSKGRSYQYYQYAADRGSRSWGPEINASAGMGNGSNGNGHVKHLPATVIDADAVVDGDQT